MTTPHHTQWATEILAQLKPANGDGVVVYGNDAGEYLEALRNQHYGPSGIWGVVALAQIAGTLHDGTSLHLAAIPGAIESDRDGFEAAQAKLQNVLNDAKIGRKTRKLRGKEWANNAMANVKHFASCRPMYDLRGRAAGAPVFIVSAGPSLDKNVHLLARAREHGYVIAVNHALKSLVRAGVRPHLVITSEGKHVDAHFAGVPPEYYSHHIITGCALPALFDLPYTTRWVARVPDDATSATILHAMGDDVLVHAGWGVSNMAFRIAQIMGAAAIVLVGQDLALSGGRVYATGADRDNETADDLTDSTLMVKRWDGGAVQTTATLNTQRRWFEDRIREWRGVVFNATEGGAHVAGAEHLLLEDVFDCLPTCPPAPLPTGPLNEDVRTKKLKALALAWKRQGGPIDLLSALDPKQ